MKGKAASVDRTEVAPKYAGFDNTMNQLGDLASRNVGKIGEAYGGQRVAGMDPLQNQAYSRFNDYMQGGGQANYMNNDLYKAARGNMSDVLGGKYLNNDNPYMNAVQNSIYGDQGYVQRGQDQLRQAQALRGNFYSQPGMREEAQLMSNAGNQYQNAMGTNWQNEMNRMMGMIPAGMQVGQQENAAPLQDIQTMIQMGEMPRQINQANLDAQYNEWMRQHQENLAPVNNAYSASQIYPKYEYTQNAGSPSMFEQITGGIQQMGGLGQIGNMFGGMFGGGGSPFSMNLGGYTDAGGYTGMLGGNGVGSGTTLGGLPNYTNSFTNLDGGSQFANLYGSNGVGSGSFVDGTGGYTNSFMNAY